MVDAKIHGEKEDCMDVVQRLNERYRNFMSDYAIFCKEGQREVADGLRHAWKWYLVKTMRDSSEGYLKAYIVTLMASTDKYVDSLKNKAL